MTSIKKLLLIIAAGTLAQAAWAAGDHAGEHGKREAYDTGGRAALMRHGGHEMQHGHSGAHASRAGEPGNVAQATRTVNVVMGEPSEFRFTPARIQVKAGETVHFRVRNAGKLAHEIVFGDAAELQEHAKSMREHAGMAHKDTNSLTLDPGKTGELVWKFTNPGEFQFACLVAGHYEAGMKGSAIVN